MDRSLSPLSHTLQLASFCAAALKALRPADCRAFSATLEIGLCNPKQVTAEVLARFLQASVQASINQIN